MRGKTLPFLYRFFTANGEFYHCFTISLPPIAELNLLSGVEEHFDCGKRHQTALFGTKRHRFLKFKSVLTIGTSAILTKWFPRWAPPRHERSLTCPFITGFSLTRRDLVQRT